jgi:folate-binding protein YgfZ
MSISAGYTALREDAGTLQLDRDVVRVSGPDAETYLQGQTSQDVAKLSPGGWAWALILQPQGKLDVFVRVYRRAQDEFVLDSDTGMGEPLVARLTRFKLRTKVEIEQLPWRGVAVRGPRSGALPLAGPDDDDGALIYVPFEWGGVTGYDLFGPSPKLPARLTAVETADYEAVRVESGFPTHGRELDDRTIPAEAGLVSAAVSFTKGCYTGQELVARIDSRGNNVPRHLRGLLLSGPVGAGARLFPQPPGDGPKEVGRLTTVALSPRLGWVALGYVGRAVELGSTLVARDEEGEAEARVEPLPLT